jgi:type III restriction enzyme
MKGFNFEKNLEHQTQAVKSTVGVFDNLEIKEATGTDKQYINPHIDIFSHYYIGDYNGNIRKIQGLIRLPQNGNRPKWALFQIS